MGAAKCFETKDEHRMKTFNEFLTELSTGLVKRYFDKSTASKAHHSTRAYFKSTTRELDLKNRKMKVTTPDEHRKIADKREKGVQMAAKRLKAAGHKSTRPFKSFTNWKLDK